MMRVKVIEETHMTQYILSATSWLDLSGIVDYFKVLKLRYKTHKNIRSTINELSKLSDKELKDIGISRGEIYDIAHECYYDNRLAPNKNLDGWV